MRFGSLFSGIDGLALGLEWSGLGHVVWQVEQDPFCRAVLAKHWPDVDRSVTDVRQASASNLAPVDLICGGWPCQDLSVAGDGGGLAGPRSGLWYEFLRIVDECQPAIVVAENVAHGRNRYLCEVRSDLRELGYDTTPLLFSAYDTDAPHTRDRCFVVAYTDGEQIRERAERQPARRARGVRTEGQTELGHLGAASGWADQSRLGGGVDGLPGGLHAPRWPAVKGPEGREWTGRHEWEPAFAVEPGPFHEERLRAIGNSVAPWCAFEVGRWILEYVL